MCKEVDLALVICKRQPYTEGRFLSRLITAETIVVVVTWRQYGVSFNISSWDMRSERRTNIGGTCRTCEGLPSDLV